MQCKVINSLYNTINSIKTRQKEAQVFKDNTTLNQADIKLIDAIALNPNQNASYLANILNISRGAISQSVNRLEKMKIIKRVPLKGNKKEKIIQLTALGKKFKEEKDKNHQADNKEICEFLKNLTADQRQAILMFLNKVKTLNISRFDCLDDYCITNEKGEQHA